MFEAIARMKQPAMTDAQVAEAFQIYLSMTDPKRAVPG